MYHPSSHPFDSHALKNVSLIIFSLLWLPFSLTLATISFLFNFQQKWARVDGPDRKTILVTGTSMTKGLVIARLLAKHTGHRIVSADTEPIPFTSPGRYSRSISKFYPIHAPKKHDKGPYIKSLLGVLKRENVNLWISCSSVTDAVEDAEVLRIAQDTLSNGFQAVQFDSDIVTKLHEKDTLIEYIRSLGLVVPESHRCTSVEQVESILIAASNEDLAIKAHRQRKFILKPIGVDDKARAQMMTLLPIAHDTGSLTRSYLSSLKISRERPFVLQQFIKGSEFCTHSLVVGGQVKAFVSCPSSDLVMHYSPLPRTSVLNRKMLEFTQRVCEKEGPKFSGHLSFDFLVEGNDVNATLYPIECNPRTHTAIVLLQNHPQMANAYLSLFGPSGPDQSIIMPELSISGYYWVGHDLVTLLVLPIVAVLRGSSSIEEFKASFKAIWNHLIYWHEATYVAWDPWPFFVLYHVYWPARFCECLIKGRKWSRINVSTTKMFES